MNILHLILGLFAMMIAFLFLSESVRKFVSAVIHNTNSKTFPVFIMIGAIGVFFGVRYIHQKSEQEYDNNMRQHVQEITEKHDADIRQNIQAVEAKRDINNTQEWKDDSREFFEKYCIGEIPTNLLAVEDFCKAYSHRYDALGENNYNQ